MEKNWTIGGLIKWGTNYFSEKKIDSPRLNIEMMLAHILNCPRIDLYLHYDYILNESELSQLRDFVKRRAKYEPLQYILGEVNFFGHLLKIDKRALIPRPETELLVSLAIENLKSITNELRILEIGTGSGCISISLAKYFTNSKITAIDISNDAISLAKENALILGVRNINFLVADFFNYYPQEKYDLIISNPPYVVESDLINLQKELSYEPKIALTAGKDSFVFYRMFVKFLDYLGDNGTMILEINEKNSEIVTKLFDELSIIKIVKDYANLDRILLIKKLQNCHK